jgi:hypothetical protein
MRQPPNIVPSRNRSVCREHHPQLNFELFNGKSFVNEDDGGNDSHRFLGIVCSVTERVGGGGDQLELPKEPVRLSQMGPSTIYDILGNGQDDVHQNRGKQKPNQRRQDDKEHYRGEARGDQ